MSWQFLTSSEGWASILKQSHVNTQVVFKHSTRCSISSLAKSRLEKEMTSGDKFYLLDLLQYRPVSNLIAADLGVTHESPQVLVIKDGRCIYHSSHSGIDYHEVIENV
jgi:bacillithiol system protein YtxJ